MIFVPPTSLSVVSPPTKLRDGDAMRPLGEHYGFLGARETASLFSVSADKARQPPKHGTRPLCRLPHAAKHADKVWAGTLPHSRRTRIVRNRRHPFRAYAKSRALNVMSIPIFVDFCAFVSCRKSAALMSDASHSLALASGLHKNTIPVTAISSAVLKMLQRGTNTTSAQ